MNMANVKTGLAIKALDTIPDAQLMAAVKANDILRKAGIQRDLGSGGAAAERAAVALKAVWEPPAGFPNSAPEPRVDESTAQGYQHADYRSGGWSEEGTPAGMSRRGDAAVRGQIKAGPQFGGNGADAEAMTRHYSQPGQQLPGVEAATDLSAMMGEVVQAMKSMTAAFQTLLAKAAEEAEEEEESEAERRREREEAAEEDDDEEERDQMQNKWAAHTANATVDDVLKGQAILSGNVNTVLMALAGRSMGSLPVERLPGMAVRPNNSMTLAKARMEAAMDSMSLEQQMTVQNIALYAAAVSQGAMSVEQFRQKLAGISDPEVQALFANLA
jgi:hypothetical protein